MLNYRNFRRCACACAPLTLAATGIVTVLDRHLLLYTSIEALWYLKITVSESIFNIKSARCRYV